MLLTLLTFQVTWMLGEVTGCKVTSMGGPSGAGGGGQEKQCYESRLGRKEPYALGPILELEGCCRERKSLSKAAENFCLSPS